MKQIIKSSLLPSGRKLRRLVGGAGRGQLMWIDLQHQLQRYLGLDEREILRDVSRFMRSSRTLVDVGANDGHYTVPFLASSAEYVIACEPGAQAAADLLLNAEANGYPVTDRFHLERRLVGSAPGEVSLAELLADRPGPVFVKVDVDGGEVGVLRSAQNYADLRQTRWLVETHSIELEQGCIDWFAKRGFRARVVDPAWWRRFVPERRLLVHNRWLVAQPES